MATAPRSDRRRVDFRLARSRAGRLVGTSGSVDDLVGAVGRERGRQIRLLTYPLGAGEPSGIWIGTGSADYVAYPVDASSAERSAIICHEIAHMLLDHRPEQTADHLSRLAAEVAPSLDPAVARRFLARHGYAEDVEADAEQLGTELVTKLNQNAQAAALRRDAVSDRLR